MITLYCACWMQGFPRRPSALSMTAEMPNALHLRRFNLGASDGHALVSAGQMGPCGEQANLRVHPARCGVDQAAAVQRLRQADHLLSVVLAPALVEHYPGDDAGEAPVLLHNEELSQGTAQ